MRSSGFRMAPAARYNMGDAGLFFSMTDDPRKGTIGSRPVLPTPSGVSATRAREMFSAYLAETRAYRERGGREPIASERPRPPPNEGGPKGPSPRHYDFALSLLVGAKGEGGQPDLPPSDAQAGAGDLPRPPVGSPAIRPSAPSRPAPEAIDQSLLETLADNALLHHTPDGAAAFEVSFHDDVFEDLACSVQIEGGEVVATFRATDPNTRRLLEAEAGRLRVRLEDRGLRVRQVRVESIEETEC